ncbi:MAG: SGNH/GDSL hydrolase family protein [candidate division NC10 bacterium]|nr:SGNH/GDSL hydrolase family protein [candidate division NC10 bacterium]MDE2320506.1 SGNH/GDSL hydrolase family protein [candidate division NC10 bacterium]
MPVAARAAVKYYVSLGDSLAAGFQPTGSFAQGYADQLFTALRAKTSGLQHVKLGCFGETTVTMITGGVCSYRHGSQLNEAVAFLQRHQGSVALITIDIGANDVNCSITMPLDMRCITDASAAVETNLPSILTALRAAAGPGVPIVGMNYYDPFLAFWLQGEGGRAAATDSRQAFLKFNDTLDTIYKAAGSPVADVEGAFSTTDFATKVVSPDFGTVPLNVARICQWTWMCTPAPLGPDIHANTEGYGVIAGAFLKVLPF